LLTKSPCDADLILFPGDASFKKASERVYCLKFSSSSTREFFWFQDVDSSKDAERAAEVNRLIGAPEEEGAMEVEA
jgi:26S proteasome regulatory subunit N13